MRPSTPSPRAPIPALALALLGPILLAPMLLGMTACSRGDDKAGAPAANSSAVVAPQAAAPVAGGPQTLKPGLWRTVTKTPLGPEDSTQCVGEGYDPGAEAAQKASPCGKPTVTRTAAGFRLDHACEKDHIHYALTGAVSGDFVTTATTDLELTVSAYGRKQVMRLQAVSTYQGPCAPG
uniref:DUF3617 family protein n=1 Tax=Caulobacter sp. (strain K31) TaxID=366602 RepID=B0SYL2_CAUSK